jgi:isopenicillin N synthase-like dioxygenase
MTIDEILEQFYKMTEEEKIELMDKISDCLDIEKQIFHSYWTKDKIPEEEN